MKVFSWNLRGVNNDQRQEVVRGWLNRSRPSVGAFLETHVREENASRIIQRIVPGWRFDSNYCSSEGGRIWLVWEPSLSVIVYKRSAQLMVCGVLDPRNKTACTLAFVYAHNDVYLRRELWNELIAVASQRLVKTNPFLVLGDFNQILLAEEHFSITHYNLPIRGMRDLQECLVDSELSDIERRGVFYTWSNNRQEDPVLRKLDRAIGNEKWREVFPSSVAIFEAPGASDHAPCIVDLAQDQGGRKVPFKYFSYLSSHPRFLSSIREAWLKEIPVGSRLFSIGQRLNAVKAACKTLNRGGFGNIQQKTKDAMSRLQEIQSELLINPSDSLFREEFVARKNWLFFEKAQEIFYKRKSRIRWLSEGDANTSFFHHVVRAHQARNAISMLRGSNGETLVLKDDIIDEVVGYFKNLLGTQSPVLNPVSVDQLKELISYRCPAHLHQKLTSIPSEEEIRSIIFSMPKNKAPGPDGFAVEFFCEAWEVVGEDIIAAIKEFFTSRRMLHKFNATAIALIPKLTEVDRITQFRPISLCSTIYKVIARLIKKRLKLIISNAVQLNQVGFVQGRLLCENVLLASELVTDFHKRGRTTRGCLKIDLSKAYDNVNWDCLFKLLQAIELPMVLIEWIKECVTTPSYSIVINGELQGHFRGLKGLRQGDPISSLLFVLLMDILSKLLDAGAVNGVFGIHPKCEAPLVTHLSFADDVLIFFDGSENSLQGILSILENFKNISGLHINNEKTEVMIDGGDGVKCRQLAEHYGLKQGSLPVRYLGLPLSSKKMRRTDFQPLIDKIAGRFNSWTVRYLSFAGRLQLIQSVIYSTITFWASIFSIPKQCILEIERMCNGFLWKGAPNSARGAKVSWDVVCTPKYAGGLGLRRLTEWNKVLGLKLIWLLFTAGGSLWVSWVRINLIGQQNFWDIDPSTSSSWIWKNICKLRPLARPMIVCEVGNGLTASFWNDNWTGLGPLLDITGERGPTLAGLPRHAVVADGLCNNRWWLSDSRSRNPVISLLRQCLPSVEPIVSSEVEDRYLWKVHNKEPTENFSVAITWNSLHPITERVSWCGEIWFKGRIPKHAFLAWVAIKDRLPSRDRLRSWGLDVPSVCLLCNSYDETKQHLFFDCDFSWEVWSFFHLRAHLSPPRPFADAVTWLKNHTPDSNLLLIFKLLFQACLYSVWKERNSRLHTGCARSPAALIEDIKQTVKYRLHPLARTQNISPSDPTYLQTWITLYG